MSYDNLQTDGMSRSYDASEPGPDARQGPGPEMMGAGTLVGDAVYNLKDEELGEIKEIMLDLRNGTVAYAVLSFGGFLGMGEKLFAVPWHALKLDPLNKRFVLNVEKARLEHAPGFDKGHWPNMADQLWAREIHSYYGVQQHSTDWRA